MTDQNFLKLAIEEGKKGQPPHLFGALVVKDNKVIAVDHNHVWEKFDPTAHAEISAIVQACKQQDNHNLNGCTLYSSHEPCLMCFSCAAWANIDRIVFATPANAHGFTYEFDEVNLQDLAKKLKRPIKIEHINV